MVVFQLDELKPLRRPKAIRNALKNLSQSLPETYDRIFMGIQSEDEKELIRRTLQFIIFAARPMTMGEISEAVVIEDCSTALDLDDRFHTPEHLVKNVRSLFTTTGEYLGLSHYTVQGYLQSPEILKGPASYFAMTKSKADEEISQRCLTYLAYDDFNIGPCEYEDEFEQRLTDYPFLKYAANYWFIHSREEQAQRSVACIFDKIWTTVESPKYLSWYQAFTDQTISTYTAYEHIDPPIVYYPALWGLHILLSRLLTDDTDVNIEGGYYGQSLQAAVAGGNCQCFELLLDHGADIHAQGGHFGSGLQACIFAGNEDMVKALVERNSPVNDVGGVCGRALYAASFRGYTDTVCMLLEAGVDVNQRVFNDPALHVAASGGHYLICDALINKGALVNAQYLAHGSVLEQASINGQAHVVELLIKRGAEVNAPGSNALAGACDAGHEEVVSLLLIHGADVSRSENSVYGTPLQAAARAGHAKIISLLVKYRADVNEQCYLHGNALQAAALNRHEETISTLLDLGADVNLVYGDHDSTLQVACDSGFITTARMLLDRGADPNIQSGIYGNSLQVAASSGKVDIVQLLLERGAKANAVGGKFHTALHAAAYNGHENIVEILLKADADVGIVGGKYGSALDVAIYMGHVNVAKRLRKVQRPRPLRIREREVVMTLPGDDLCPSRSDGDGDSDLPTAE